jgi:hypothetical protein
MNKNDALLANFAARYIWWREAHAPWEERFIAQVMNLGTYEDIRRLETAYGAEELRAVMLRAQRGWISERSWDFWRGRLTFAGAGPIPQAPPRRTFDAESMSLKALLVDAPLEGIDLARERDSGRDVEV